MSKLPKLKPQFGPGLCNLCLRRENSKIICMQGYGSTTPELVTIAEAPSTHEDNIGRPLVGPAGKLLDKALHQAGFDRDNVFATNIVRCSAGGSVNPTMIHVRKCKMYLLEELESLDWSQCVGVMLLGKTATRGVLDRARLSMKDTRLRVLDEHGPRKADDTLLIPVPLRATYHPASALPHRNPEFFDEIVGDLMDLRRRRDTLAATQHIETTATLDWLLGTSELFSLDLEWTSQNNIRVAGLSNGEHNVSTTPEAMLQWLNEKR